MRYITVLVFMLCFVVAAMGQTNTTGVSTTGGGINPTEAPTVTATVTLVVELSANSANDFNTTALEEAFATSLNVSSDDVTVTVRPVSFFHDYSLVYAHISTIFLIYGTQYFIFDENQKSTKRASLFELVITLKKQVEAGSSPTALSSEYVFHFLKTNTIFFFLKVFY